MHIPRPGTADIHSRSQTCTASQRCLCRRGQGHSHSDTTPHPSPKSFLSTTLFLTTRAEGGWDGIASIFFRSRVPLEIPSLGAMKLSHFVFLVFQTLYFISPPAAEKDEQKARAGSKKSIHCRKTEDLFLFFISDAGYPGNITANKAGGYCPPAQARSSNSPPQSSQRGTPSLPGKGLARWKMLSLHG